MPGLEYHCPGGCHCRPHSGDTGSRTSLPCHGQRRCPLGRCTPICWADLFRKFGAKPQRTPCSAEALRKRVARDGSLPSIDPVVDLYNAISIEYAIPVGGENLTTYEGMPRLVVADGSELFDTMKGGEVAHESPEPGEVVWRDDKGVTCRRWNWRQGVRTRLSVESSMMWFILESLPEMPQEALQAAGNKLIEGIQQMMPGAVIEQTVIGHVE
ncbi:B3/B4 domain-containing protein [Aeromonas salmonicida]